MSTEPPAGPVVDKLLDDTPIAPRNRPAHRSPPSVPGAGFSPMKGLIMDQPSVEFCKAQAAAHLARAEESDLPNVRAKCLTAAQSWLREAESAKRIFDRRARSAPVG